jgi:hypothetical protein
MRLVFSPNREPDRVRWKAAGVRDTAVCPSLPGWAGSNPSSYRLRQGLHSHAGGGGTLTSIVLGFTAQLTIGKNTAVLFSKAPGHSGLSKGPTGQSRSGWGD